jgi:multiple sugar transport system permease protein
VLLSVAIGLALALLVDRAVILLPIARNALVWPAVVTPVVVSVIWLLILSPTVGVLNKALESLGLPAQGWINSGFGAFSAVVVIDVWHWTPLVFLFIYTALKGISPELYEAARTDGATERQTLFHVTLPLLRPALAIIMLLRTVQGVKAFDEMFLLTHGGPNNATNLISLRIRSLFFDQLNFGSAAATSLYAVIAVLLVVAVAVLIRNLRKGRVRG